MGSIHDGVQGIHMLHWLTVAVPLATLVVVTGMLRPTKAARLLLVGIATTLATVAVTSVAAGASTMRMGAPLAFARAGLDPLGADASPVITLLRACLVADLLFWCSSAILLGALIQSLARGLAGRGWRAPSHRPRPAAGSTA